MSQPNIIQQTKDSSLFSQIYEKTERIRGAFGLHIDQLGELDAEIVDILDGKKTSDNFVKDITERLEIDAKLAAQIAQEVNKEIFQVVKSNLQSQTQAKETDSTISSIEHVGGFSVEKEAGNGNFDENKPLDRERVLQGLENPLHHTAEPPENLPTDRGSTLVSRDVVHSEPIVDYLLQNPMGQNEHKSVVDHTAPVPVAKAPAVTAPKFAPAPPPVKPVPKVPPRSGPDPYREQPK